MNLVVNARDAMPEGGELTIETRNIEVATKSQAMQTGVTPGSYVRLAVTDTGHGMDQETLAQAFEPFFTTKERGKGTGLGLATVYGIVHKCGGNIVVDSAPGKGTTFSLYLPSTLAEASRGKPQRVEPPAHRDRGTETLLVVEDDAALREVVRRPLEAAGYRVLLAGDGVEALEMSAQFEGEIALLLTDVIMPLMNGRAVAESLLQLRPGLRVLYMSGYTDNALAKHGVLDESIHLLMKPFTATELKNKIRELLDAPASTRSEVPSDT
jgi:CheY-like chemotaxis protein